jgi:hypothetical protein
MTPCSLVGNKHNCYSDTGHLLEVFQMQHLGNWICFRQ